MDTDNDIDPITHQGEQLIKVILSSAPSDYTRVEALVQAGAPLWFQEGEGGFSALHAACFVENPQMVKMLIEKGAVWNCVDHLGNTAADIALSVNDRESYRIVRDAGMRSEYLLQFLSSRSCSPAEVIRHPDSGPFGSTEAFLKSNLVFAPDAHGQPVCSVVSGDTTVGVMMGWERAIMQATAEKLCATHPSLSSGLRILNIGFGLGIIDTFFESLDYPPSQHTIVEPHRDVLNHIREEGWYEKRGVRVLEGKWQDFVETGEIFCGEGWDVVYVDTFAEGYEELKRFFDIVPDLLSGPDARFSFFNGLGATNAVFYDVYTQLAELHLKDAGVAVTWSDVDIEDDTPEQRWGDTREYFKVRLYRLPLGKMIHV